MDQSDCPGRGTQLEEAAVFVCMNMDGPQHACLQQSGEAKALLNHLFLPGQSLHQLSSGIHDILGNWSLFSGEAVCTPRSLSLPQCYLSM